MDTELKLNKILTQVKKLNKLDQVILVKKISGIINESKPASKAASLIQLCGLGAEVWHGADIDKYVDDERQW